MKKYHDEVGELQNILEVETNNLKRELETYRKEAVALSEFENLRHHYNLIFAENEHLKMQLSSTGLGGVKKVH